MLSACGDDDGGDNAGETGSPLMTMLAAVPDEPNAMTFLAYNDLTLLAEQAGIDRPSDNASIEDVDEWWTEMGGAIAGLDAPVLGFSDLALQISRNTEGARTELGFDIADVEQIIQTGSPPGSYYLQRGRFEAGDVDSAVRSDPNWSGDLEVKSESGVDYYSWLGDYEQSFDHVPTAHDALGRGGRLALRGKLLLWALGTDEMTGMLRASTDAEDSLADREDFADMAGALDALGVYSVLMTTTFESAANRDIDGEPLLLPYVSYSAASGTDADGPFLALVIANVDIETAAQNVDRLAERISSGTMLDGTPWSERITSHEIHSEGTLTIAKLRGDALPWDFSITREPLLLTE